MKRLIFLILVLILSSSFVLSQGACTVVTESSCDTSSDYLKVIRISAQENAHAERVDGNNYNLVVCCDVSNVHFTVVYGDETFSLLELSSSTNAHVQTSLGPGNYLVPFGFNHTASGQPWDECNVKLRSECDYLEGGNEFCVFDLFSLTNSHIAQCDSLWVDPYVVCCSGTTSGPSELCNNGVLDDGEICDGGVGVIPPILTRCPDYFGWEPIGCELDCSACLYQDPNHPGWASAFIQSDCVACEGSAFTIPGYGTVNCDLGGGYYNSTVYSYGPGCANLISCMAGLCSVETCEVGYQLSACFLDKEEEVPFFDWFSVVLTFGLLVSYYYNRKRKSL